MLVKCDVCKTNDVNVKSFTYCSGSVNSIECGCKGQEQYEGYALCSDCISHLEYFESFNFCISYRENGEYINIDSGDIAELEE